MRMPLVVQGQQSPLANAFTDIAKTILTAPSQEELDQKAAMTRYYGASADKANAEVRAAASQQQATQNAQRSIADIMRPFVAGNTGPVPQESFVGPAPAAGLAPERPEDRASRLAASFGGLAGQVGPDNWKAMQPGIATGLALGGGADGMRTASLLTGQAGALKPDFAPTAAEGNRISTRDALEDQDQAVAKAQARPLSLAEVRGGLLQDNWSSLPTLPVQQQQALGGYVEPPSQNGRQPTPRNYITPDGRQGVTLDGMTDAANQSPLPQGSQISTAQVKPTSSTDLMKPVQTDVQKQLISLNAVDALTKVYEQAVSQAPEEAFGATGSGLALGLNLGEQAKVAAGALQQMGFQVDPMQPEAAVDSAFQQVVAGAQQAVARGQLSEELYKKHFDPAVAARGQLAQLHSILLFRVAGGFLGQEGKGVTDADVRRTENVLPNPTDLLSNKAKIQGSIPNLYTVSNTLRSALPQMPGVQPYNPQAGGMNPPPTGAVAPPQIGEIRKGFKYVGGPPGSPSSWQKVMQ